jgi:hypothetical protein
VRASAARRPSRSEVDGTRRRTSGPREVRAMNITVRTILLAAAVVLFVLGLLIEDQRSDLVTIGLAVFAGAFLVDELGVLGRVGTRR